MKIVHNKEHKQINFLDERFYTKDDVHYYPSVTTILDVYPKGIGFKQWLKSYGIQSDEIVKRAAEQGTHVHDAIDRYLTGEVLTWVNEEGKQQYTLEEWLMILKAQEFFDTHNPETIGHEVSLVSETLEYGGTTDYVGVINDEIWLIDYKTSNYLHTTYELQLAAYAMMWNEVYPEYIIEKTGILHLKAATRGPIKGKMQGEGWLLKTFNRPYQQAFTLFQHAQAIWKEENPTYVPKNKTYPDTIQKK